MTSSHPRRVLFICYGRPFGGAETYTGRLAQLLKDDIECFALSGTPELTSYLERLGVKVVGYRACFKDGWLWYLEFLLVCICLLPYLRWKYGVGTIWIQGFREAFILPWARLMGYGALATMHMTRVIKPTQAFYPYMLLFAHRIICVSQTVADTLPAFVPRKKISVIHNWVSTMAAKSPRTIGTDGLKLLYVGRLLKYKGVSLIIVAVRRLSQKYPAKTISLEIVGAGSDRSAFEEEAAGLNVTFVGFQDDPSSVYRENNVFIHPTYGPEGSSLVCLEAMSHGMPVIMSDLQVNREISGAGRYAKLFQRGNVEDLIARLEDFLLVPEEFAERSLRSYQAVEGKFSAQIAHVQYRNVLLGHDRFRRELSDNRSDPALEIEH